MNKVGKSGAIITIIASAFMIIFAFVLIFLGGFLAAMNHSAILGIGIACLTLGVANIILSSLALAGRKGCNIAAGVTVILSVFLGWAVYVFPAILLLISGILLFCGKTNSISKTREENVEIKTVQPEMQA